MKKIDEGRDMQGYGYDERGKEWLLLKLDGGWKETMVKRNKTTKEVVNENWPYKGRQEKPILPSKEKLNWE